MNAGGITWIWTINLLNHSPVEVPITNRFCNGLFDIDKVQWQISNLAVAKNPNRGQPPI